MERNDTEANPLRPKLTRRPRKVRARPYRNPERPLLRYVVNYREAGERRRRYFEKEAEATTFAADKNDERRQFGTTGADFPMWLRVQAQDATKLLMPFGKSITDAAKFYAAHLKTTERSCSAEQLVTELRAAKEKGGASERHLRDIKHRLSRFAKYFNGKPVAAISTRELEDFLDGLLVAPMTRNHYRTVIHGAYNFAVRRGYAVENPVAAVPKAKERNKPPGILSVEQASALLVNASPEILPYIAVGLFAGLRRAELQRHRLARNRLRVRLDRSLSAKVKDGAAAVGNDSTEPRRMADSAPEAGRERRTAGKIPRDIRAGPTRCGH